MRLAFIVGAATLLLAQTAFAQTVPSSNQPAAPKPGQAAQGQDQQSVRAQIQKNLQTAGFTDIRIMPSSFLVRAKDRDGNPVMMIINPDSVTEITGVPGSQGTTGSGTNAQPSRPTGSSR